MSRIEIIFRDLFIKKKVKSKVYINGKFQKTVKEKILINHINGKLMPG